MDAPHARPVALRAFAAEGGDAAPGETVSIVEITMRTLLPKRKRRGTQGYRAACWLTERKRYSAAAGAAGPSGGSERKYATTASRSEGSIFL